MVEIYTQLPMIIDANTDVDLVNSDDTQHKVTVTPLQCCIFVEENDIDCEVCINIVTTE